MSESGIAGYRLYRRGAVDSTNDEARRLIEGGRTEFALLAEAQRSGRGRRGRGWVSPAGNLFLSIGLSEEGPPARLAQFTFIASLAVQEALATAVAAPERPACKWPNDVLCGGRKIAGILLESATGGGPERPHLIVGIGVNIADAPKDTPYPATALAAVMDRAPGPEELARDILARFDHWRRRWRQDGFEPVRRAWLDRAAGLGETIDVHLDKETRRGIFRGLAEDGTLLLDTGAGEVQRIAAGDVFFAQSARGPEKEGHGHASGD